jgi:dynein heavy chain
LEKLPEDFDFMAISEAAEPLLKSEESPFIVVALQEVGRMNQLLQEVRNSLIELQKGLGGQLNISDAMEDLATALSINEVPGRNPFSRASWERLAWPSKKSLGSWFSELLQRVEQLQAWVGPSDAPTLKRPISLWLSGLFSPTAFLTAIMQVTARKNDFPLDNMTIETHVTTLMTPADALQQPEEGAFIHGLFMQGARWALKDADEQLWGPYKVCGVQCAGYLADSYLKELLPPMPLLFVRAVTVKDSWIPDSVGYLRNDPSVYEVPIYLTTQRGPTYVTLGTLRSKDAISKWVLSGVAFIMQEDD